MPPLQCAESGLELTKVGGHHSISEQNEKTKKGKFIMSVWLKYTWWHGLPLGLKPLALLLLRSVGLSTL